MVRRQKDTFLLLKMKIPTVFNVKKMTFLKRPNRVAPRRFAGKKDAFLLLKMKIPTVFNVKKMTFLKRPNRVAPRRFAGKKDHILWIKMKIPTVERSQKQTQLITQFEDHVSNYGDLLQFEDHSDTGAQDYWLVWGSRVKLYGIYSSLRITPIQMHIIIWLVWGSCVKL